MENHYGTLELPPFSSTEEIKRQFRRLAKSYHPDIKGTGDRKKYDSIRGAYEILSNSATRKDYDKQIRESVVEKEKTRFAHIDIGTKISIVLAWSTTNKKFNPSVVNSLANRLAEGKQLTSKQEAVIDNIIQGFGIPLNEWLDENKMTEALERYFKGQF